MEECPAVTQVIRVRFSVDTPFIASIAQLEERDTCNIQVAGSIPAWGSNLSRVDLGSSFRSGS
jgi:hypothetical protein